MLPVRQWPRAHMTRHSSSQTGVSSSTSTTPGGGQSGSVPKSVGAAVGLGGVGTGVLGLAVLEGELWERVAVHPPGRERPAPAAAPRTVVRNVRRRMLILWRAETGPAIATAP